MASHNKSTKKSLKKQSKKSIKKSEKKTEKKDAKKDTKKDAKKKAEKEPTVVVLFFAHWCGHCQAMYPEWEKLRKEYEHNDDFILREIEHGNMDEQKQLLEKEYDISPIQVTGFPTLTKFHPHEQIEYYEGGERTKENFMNWLQGGDSHDDPSEWWQRAYYGGYKIPLMGKIKMYSKNKTTKSKSKASKSKTSKKLIPLSSLKK